MDQKYSHSHDAVSVVDRMPLLIMISVSIGFGIFPMHLYNVVRSGVDPLVARITHVVPVAAHDGLAPDGKATASAQPSLAHPVRLPGDPASAPSVSRSAP
jgi:NADH-quinone oxidoreductase subunit M